MSEIEKSETIKIDLEDESKKKQVVHAVKDLLLISSSHGLPSILRSERLFLKIMWTIFFLVSASFGCYTVIQSIIDYLEYDVVTKIRQIHERPLNFPTVTICNQNPFTTNYSNEYILNFFNKEYNLTATNMQFIYKNLNEYEITNSFERLISTISDPDLDINKKQLFSLNLTETIRKCKYNDFTCNLMIDFESISIPYWGNCFRFNYAQSNDIIKKTNNIGLDFGLQLELAFNKLNIEDRFGFNKKIGFRIFINDQKVRPAYNEGFDIEPGQCSNIIIEKVHKNSLPKPYSSCQDLANFKSNLYDLIKDWPYEYRYRDCLDMCYQNYIITKCNCYDTYYAKLKSNIEPCYLSKEKYECLSYEYSQFIKSNEDEDCLKQCPIDCESIDYDMKLSISDYPSRGYYDYEISKENSSYNGRSIEEIKENYACLNIYYEEFKYMHITEQPKLTSFDMVGIVGGTLGLFIGISILSVAEVFEMFFESLFILLGIK